MATTTASDLSAFGDSKDNAIMVDLDNMDASDVDKLVEAATVNGNGKRNGKRKTISSGGSSSSTPSSYASNKKRRTQKKKKKKVTSSHSSSKMQVDAPEVLAVPAPNFPLFGFVDVAYLVFTVIWTACDLGSLMVEKSPDYESLRVRAFEELRGDEANDIEFPQHLARHKTELIALVKENNWTTTTDVTLYKRKCEVDDMKGGLEGVQHQTLLFALLVYMDWRVNGLAESKPALFDESKTIKECVKGLDFDYSSVGSAKNYFIETLWVATTGQDLPSHFTMKELGHVENGKEHALKKKKMWKALCDTESSFLRKMVSALREERGDKRKAADRFWKELTPAQQQALQDAATCVSAPDEATCKNFVMPDGKRSKKAVPAKCSAFDLVVNDDNEFEFVVPQASDGKKDAPHYVYLERPVEDKVQEQIERVMFGEESSDEVIKALYGVLSLVKRVKKGKGNPLRWKESFIDAMNAFVVTLNQEDEDDDDDDDASSASDIDSDDSSSESDDEESDDENDGDQDNKGNRP